jgi:hypothetical protein
MFLSRFSALSFVGFALLVSACPDEMEIQRPDRNATVGQAGGAHEDEPAQTLLETEDAGVDEVDASGSEEDAASAEADAGSEADAGDDAGSHDDDKGAGLPCEINALLKRCQGCHSAQAKNGTSLITHANLMAPSKSDNSVAVWSKALERMASSEKPMPPMGRGQPVTEEELATFEAWVNDGAPAERCDD